MGDGGRTGSKRGVVIGVGVVVVLVGLAVGLPMVFGSLFSGSEIPVEDRARAVREQMDSARRAYEAEADVDVVRRAEPVGGLAERVGETVTPGEVAPKIGARADASGIVSVWLEAPSFAPGAIVFDRARDSMTVTFGTTGDRRAVAMSDLFTGGVWEIRPGGRSSEFRTTAPAGFSGEVEIEFVHVSAQGGRSVVRGRVGVK